jgi:DNA invertase Pin-like site-specific DNA recombinase
VLGRVAAIINTKIVSTQVGPFFIRRQNQTSQASKLGTAGTGSDLGARARRFETKSDRPNGRPRAIFRRDMVEKLREEGLSWQEIARQVGASVGTVRREYRQGIARQAAAPMSETLLEFLA